MNTLLGLASGSQGISRNALARLAQFLGDCLSTDTATAQILASHSTQVEQERSTLDFDLQNYSAYTTRVLHSAFYGHTIFRCNCSSKSGAFRLLDAHSCALCLDGEGKQMADRTHWYFNSVIQSKYQLGHEWTNVQFQLPKNEFERCVSARL